MSNSCLADVTCPYQSWPFKARDRARVHLHTFHVLLRCAINTHLAKCLPYYRHLEIELFVRRKNYFVSYFSIIQLNKFLKVLKDQNELQNTMFV